MSDSLRSIRGVLSYMPLYIKVGLGVLVVYLFYLLERTVTYLG